MYPATEWEFDSPSGSESQAKSRRASPRERSCEAVRVRVLPRPRDLRVAHPDGGRTVDFDHPSYGGNADPIQGGVAQPPTRRSNTGMSRRSRSMYRVLLTSSLSHSPRSPPARPAPTAAPRPPRPASSPTPAIRSPIFRSRSGSCRRRARPPGRASSPPPRPAASRTHPRSSHPGATSPATPSHRRAISRRPPAGRSSTPRSQPTTIPSRPRPARLCSPRATPRRSAPPCAST